MKIRSITVAQIMGLAGVAIWLLAVSLRDTSLASVHSIQVVLGIVPNIGAAWAFVALAGACYCSLGRGPLGRRSRAAISVAILVLAVASETFHDAYLGSPFDVYDIAATLSALMAMGAVSEVVRRRAPAAR